MAFYIQSCDDGHLPPFEYLPASAFTPKMGMALVLSSGKLAKCGATATPEYISLADASANLTAGTIIPVMRVDHDFVYATTAAADASAVAIGTKVTINSDGLQVTATSTSGVAEIVGLDDGTVGTTVYVRF